MSNDKYQHIHMATNDRLAFMLEELSPFMATENDCEIIQEAAARLRTKHKTPFNSEQFE